MDGNCFQRLAQNNHPWQEFMSHCVTGKGKYLAERNSAPANFSRRRRCSLPSADSTGKGHSFASYPKEKGMHGYTANHTIR